MKLYPHYMGSVPDILALTPFPLFGVELEIEQITGPLGAMSGNFWSAKSDHSLRDNGMEFVSPPSLHEDIMVAFRNLHAVGTYGPNAFSTRTSTHVHLNCLPLDMEEIRTLVLLYALFEEFFFSMTHPHRRGNIHCVPLTETFLPQHYNKALPIMITVWSKYTALNLKRLEDLGTVEFRHLHGSSSAPLLDHWLTIIGRLYSLAQNVSIDPATMSDERSIQAWFDYLFHDTPVAGLRSSLFNIARNTIMDVKLSLLKD